MKVIHLVPQEQYDLFGRSPQSMVCGLSRDGMPENGNSYRGSDFIKTSVLRENEQICPDCLEQLVIMEKNKGNRMEEYKRLVKSYQEHRTGRGCPGDERMDVEDIVRLRRDCQAEFIGLAMNYIYATSNLGQGVPTAEQAVQHARKLFEQVQAEVDDMLPMPGQDNWGK